MPAVAKKNKPKAAAKPEGVPKQPLILSNRPHKRSPKKPTAERNEKGIIYVKHLPHGFFENQLRSFFSQFGNVTRVHVARSKRTLRSRGYAYVEFSYREVAQIASETMNNYLMFGKLLKTGLLPAGAKRIPRKYERAFDANGNETTTYNLWLKRQVAKGNAAVTKTRVVKRNIRAVRKLRKLKGKYATMGIDFDVDDVTPDFGEDGLKVPKHDPEEAENRAKKDRKKAKQLKKLETTDLSVLSIDADKEEDEEDDSSDDDEDASFLPLESADWDVPMSDDGDEGGQENQPDQKQIKSSAVEFAKKTKVRLDKEKQKTQKGPRPLVLRPAASSTDDTSPEKPVSKKTKATKAAPKSLPQTTEPESSPDKPKKGPKAKPAKPQKAGKGKKVTGGGVTKKSKGKTEKVRDQKKAPSPVKKAAKAMLKDPSVKKAQAKDINKRKKK